MAGASSRCPACIRATRAPASATSACTACRFTTGRPPACTGSGRRWRPSTTAKRCARRLWPEAPARSAKIRARGSDGGVRRRRGHHSRRPGRRPAAGDAGQNARLALRSCSGHRHRPGDDILRHRSRAAGGRGVHDRRLPARQARRDREVRDRRSGSAGARRNRARGLRRAGRTAQRRPLRRPHRLLHA